MTQTQLASPPSSPSLASSPPLRVKELLAACVSAGWLAGEVIREVVADNVDLGMVNKAADKYDPQTVADRRGQQRMIHALRALWPNLQIVGEEGDLEDPEPRDAVSADIQSLLGDVQITVPEELSGDLDANELVLWMDPLDGTKKFAEKKYDEVSVLLGIAYHRRPVVGIMHLPFHGENNGQTLWGGPGIGLFKTTHRPGLLHGVHERQHRPAPLYPHRGLHITTSGTNCERVNHALEALKPAHVKYGGATGTMVMSVVTGESDAFFRFRNATKRWDICAVEPLLEAIGGRIVSKYGEAYEYEPLDDGSDYDNAHGLIATLDQDVERLVRSTMDEVDVMRTLSGEMMTPTWFQQHVFQSSEVTSVHVERGSVARGKQSIVARLTVQLHVDSESITKAIFLKRYVKEELPPRGARHWVRDMTSYRSEARFYASVYPLLKQYSIRLIHPIDVRFRTDAQGNETMDGFIVMLENVLHSMPSTRNQLVPRDSLSVQDTQHALDYLAVLHASAIKTPAIMDRVREYLWDTGAWWSYHKRGDDELRNAPRVWAKVLAAFEPVLAVNGVEVSADLRGLGSRMVTHAAYVNAQLYGPPSDSFRAFKTLVHGDFKTANMFFDSMSGQVTAFDWQWAGVGLGVLDVANLLNTSVGIDALAEENQLLRYYFDRFRHELGHFDANYTFEDLLRHFEFATMEYGRVLIANFWEITTPEACEGEDGANTNWGLSYRSVPHVLRMMRKLDDGLRVVEAERMVTVE